MSLDRSQSEPTPFEAHAFVEPAPGADPERCALCGELRIQIRHHPTRVRAARLLRERGSDTLEASPRSK